MLSSPNDESPANVEAAVSDPSNFTNFCSIFMLHLWQRVLGIV